MDLASQLDPPCRRGNYRIDYAQAEISARGQSGLLSIEALREELSDRWVHSYMQMTPDPDLIREYDDICEFDDQGVTYIFDVGFRFNHVAVPANRVVDGRVIAAHCVSRPPERLRDTARMRGYGRPPEDYDKGHFIAHSIGGGLDPNVFTQRTEINRGWSGLGKLYRKMERYAAEHPGTFCFSRPVYCDAGSVPVEIDYGVLVGAQRLWVETFPNR